jgi:hypothetical protein
MNIQRIYTDLRDEAKAVNNMGADHIAYETILAVIAQHSRVDLIEAQVRIAVQDAKDKREQHRNEQGHINCPVTDYYNRKIALWLCFLAEIKVDMYGQATVG